MARTCHWSLDIPTAGAILGQKGITAEAAESQFVRIATLVDRAAVSSLRDHHVRLARSGASAKRGAPRPHVTRRIGERYRDRPSIVPTLYKTLCCSILLLAFSVLEHLPDGCWHGKTISVTVREVLEPGIWKPLSPVQVEFLALLPLFAVLKVGRVSGDGKLFALFFTEAVQ